MWDQKLSKEIEKLSPETMNQAGRPVRISTEEFIRRLEHRSWFEQQLDKLLKTAKSR